MSGGRHYLRVLGLGCLLLGSPVCIPGRSQAAAPGATLFATPVA